MATQAAHTLSHEWARVCKKLPADQIAKVLNRIAINFAKVPVEVDLRGAACFRPFLEKHVIRVISPSVSIRGSGKLDVKDLLAPLQSRALYLGRSRGMQPKDISLVLNAYAKIYDNSQQSKGYLQKHYVDTRRLMKLYVLQMFPEARRLVGQMNEQDLSLVLNCASKLGVVDDEFLTVANNTLVRHLRAHYGSESDECAKDKSQGQSNLLSQFTPQGMSLVLNCFSKSNVALDEGVLAFIVHKYLPRNLNNFLTHQLVVLMHSFLKLKVPFKDISATLCHLDRVVAAEYDERNTKLLSACLYTFGKYNCMPTEIAKHMNSETSTKTVVGCSELELSNLYYGLGKLNLRCTRFLERLNTAVASIVHRFTPQGISTVYYALSRLDMATYMCKVHNSYLVPSLNDLLLRRFVELVKLNQKTMKSEHRATSNEMGSVEVLPLHLLNVCFSAATCLVPDGRQFGTILVNLVALFHTLHSNKLHSPLVGEINSSSKWTGVRAGQSDAASLKEATDADQYTVEFITKELGTQGMYQLYCICQHIMMYVSGGLWSQRVEVLKLLVQLFDMWDLVSRGRPSSFLYKNNASPHDDGNLTKPLVDPVITTSKIQADVLSVLETHIRHSHVRHEFDSTHETNNSTLKTRPLVVTEAQVTPYVIDILLYSV